MRRAGHGATGSEDDEPQREGHGASTGPSRAAEGRTQPRILSAAFGMAHPMLAYKAEDAGTRLRLSNTRQLKPSQRCSACWAIVPKFLSERMPVCPPCGHVMPRDRNSALVVLIDAIATQNTPGTGVAARPKPLPRQRGKSRSVTRETPAPTPRVSRREHSSVAPRNPAVQGGEERSADRRSAPCCTLTQLHCIV